LKPEHKREAITKLLEAYMPSTPPPPSYRPSLNAMDMVRIVIRNAGRPLPAERIRAGVVETFGIHPPKTLRDILWKKARQKVSGLTKIESAEFSLVEMLPRFG